MNREERAKRAVSASCSRRFATCVNATKLMEAKRGTAARAYTASCDNHHLRKPCNSIRLCQLLYESKPVMKRIVVWSFKTAAPLWLASLLLQDAGGIASGSHIGNRKYATEIPLRVLWKVLIGEARAGMFETVLRELWRLLARLTCRRASLNFTVVSPRFLLSAHD